jgi:hypothetical protein
VKNKNKNKNSTFNIDPYLVFFWKFLLHLISILFLSASATMSYHSNVLTVRQAGWGCERTKSRPLKTHQIWDDPFHFHFCGHRLRSCAHLFWETPLT